MTAEKIERFLFVNDVAIVSDYSFYHRHTDDIDGWLAQHQSSRQGLVINFSSEKIRTLFMLRWG